MERYSVFTKPWKTQSVDELIEIIHKMGYNAIEFPLRDGYQVEPANAERDLPKLVARLKEDDIIKELHAAGTTILLVEQNAEMALKIADRAYVLESGRIVLSGKGSELAQSDAIKKAYLGG